MADSLTTPGEGFVSEDEKIRQQVLAMSAQKGSGTPPPAVNPSVPKAAEYPNDPATLSGARNNPLYLGPTNFGTIQKQYTPYQIEQATRRDTEGNIYWKEGVDINKVPTSAPATPFKAPTVAPTPTTGNLPPGSTSADANVTRSGSPMDAFAASQSAASETYLKGIQSTIDGLLAKQQEMQTAQKAEADGEMNTLKGRLNSIMNGSNQAQAALDSTRAMFDVENSIKTLTTIQQKIADASAALDQGILYEESRPVRMQLLTGRSAELKKQGIASIGALQMASEVVKGNIDLARSYASDTIDAIKQDNAERTQALNTLLDLANDKLVRLDDQERETIDRRMSLLEDESKNLDAQKDQLLDLAIKYPSAFATGGVTFTDSPEAALSKMLPTMSAQEQEQYQLDIQQKQATLAKTKAAGSGGGSGGSSSAILGGAFDNDMLEYIDYLFAQNTPLDEVIKQLGGPTKLSKKQLDALQDAWSTYSKAAKTVTASDLLNNYGIDPAEHPEYIGLTEDELKSKLQIKNDVKIPVVAGDLPAAKQAQSDADAKLKDQKWYNPFSWF